jgi:hyperosmotically inducible protein
MKKYILRTSLVMAASLLALIVSPAVRAEDANSVSDTTTNSNKDADNSQRNQRDRDNATRTPIEQGNSREDIQTTRQIRQSVVSGTNNFSIMAQNIKIITLDGRVTLRGPVKTDEEKSSIDAIAREIAGNANVNDLLEVKNNP